MKSLEEKAYEVLAGRPCNVCGRLVLHSREDRPPFVSLQATPLAAMQDACGVSGKVCKHCNRTIEHGESYFLHKTGWCANDG